MNTKSMQMAIVEHCQDKRAYLDTQFVENLTDEEFHWVLEADNWEPHDDPDDIDENTREFCFDCYPFEDQLRAYVTVDDNGKVVGVMVCGE